MEIKAVIGDRHQASEPAITVVSGFDYFLHAIAFALNNYGIGMVMVKEAIKQR